jgi:hypothetical protein
LTVYRYHANNMSKHRRLLTMDGLKVLARALQRSGNPAVRRALRASRAEHYRQLAHLEYEADHLDAARILFWGGLTGLDWGGVRRLCSSSLGVSKARISSLRSRMSGHGGSAR